MSGRANAQIYRRKAENYREFVEIARRKGNASSHGNSALKADVKAERFEVAVAEAESEIIQLRSDQKKMQVELTRLER